MKAEDWRALIKEYLLIGTLPSDKMKAIKLIKRAASYSLLTGSCIEDLHHHRSLSACLQRKALMFLGKYMREFYGLHIGFRALAAQTIRVGFYWHSILQESKDLVKKSDKCQGSPQLR